MTQAIQIFQAEVLCEDDLHNTQALCHYAMLTLEDVISMVEEGILEPKGSSPEFWMFSLRDFQRSRIISRLRNDLGANLEGAAVIAELLEAR
jgi:chaperone modulatory protein CbpM